MSWDYTKDSRTDEQVKRNYDDGKFHENLILTEISRYRSLVRIEGDKFKDDIRYKPEAFVIYRGEWRPLEVKWTDCHLSHVEWKLNQYEWAEHRKGLYIQQSGTRFCLIRPFEEHELILADTYCKKPCMRFKNVVWVNSLKELIELF